MKLKFPSSTTLRMRTLCTLLVFAVPALGGCFSAGNEEPKYPVHVIQMNPPGATLRPGEFLTITAVARDDAQNTVSGKHYIWASSDSSTVLTLAGGYIQAKKVGTASVTATVDGVVGSTTITVVAAALGN